MDNRKLPVPSTSTNSPLAPDLAGEALDLELRLKQEETFARSGGEKGLRGSGAGTIGVPLEGTRRVWGLQGAQVQSPGQGPKILMPQSKIKNKRLPIYITGYFCCNCPEFLGSPFLILFPTSAALLSNS